MRQENLRAMAGLAGSGGSGAAEKSSGPNGRQGHWRWHCGSLCGYGARVAAKVKPNIVYPDVVSGNPRAEVRVRAAPDGTITGVQLVKSSGNKAWDDAVVRALHKTETLPKDTNGKVPSEFTFGFRQD